MCAEAGGPTWTKGLSAQIICAGIALVLRASITAGENCNEETPFTEKPEMLPESLLGIGLAVCLCGRGWRRGNEKHGAGLVLQGPAV